jgi:hypothetical protein
MLAKFMNLINGRKTTIATIIGLLITFSLARGWIADDVATLLAGIMAALGFTANVVNARSK